MSRPRGLCSRCYGARPEASERQMPDRVTDSQSVGSSPAGNQVRSTKVAVVVKEASPPLRVLSRRGGGQEASTYAAREPYNRRRLSSTTPRNVVSEQEPRRDQSPAEPGIGHLSPPSDYPEPRIGSTSEPLPEPRQAPPPNYFAGPPAYGYAPSYRMHGYHLDRDLSVKKRSLSKCRPSPEGITAGPALKLMEVN